MRRRRPLFWLVLAFCAGIFLDDTLQPGLPVLGGMTLGLLLIAVSAVATGPGGPLKRTLFLLLGLCAGLAGGALVHARAARFPGADDVTRRTPSAPSLAWLEGTLTEVQRARPGGRHETWVLDLAALGPTPDDLTPASGRVQLAVSPPSVPEAPAPEGEAAPSAAALPFAEAQRVRLLARLEAPSGATLPESFDSAAYLARQGLRRVGVSTAGCVTPLGPAPWWRLDLWLRRWSGQLAARNAQTLDPERAALLNALLLGRRENLDASDREAFARAGTAHLLAISGLHVQCLAGVLWWVLARLGCSRRRACVAVLLFVSGYACLCGAAPPVIRAALMTAVYLGTIFWRRQRDPLTTLAAAAGALLLFRPDDLFTASFQLSFLAVLALATLYPTLEAAWKAWRPFPEHLLTDPEELWRLAWGRRFRQACFISLAAWLGTAAPVAWHMGYFNLASIAVNLVAVPLALVALVSGAALCVSGMGALADPLGGPLTLLLGFNRWSGSFAWASLDMPVPGVWLCLAYAGVLIWIWTARGRAATLPRLALLVPAALLSLVATALFRPAPEHARVTVLDLWRGRAALVETPDGGAALIDAGGPGDGRALAESLRRQGLRELALLVVTEDDSAALGGLPELLQKIRVRHAVLPRSLAPSIELREAEELLLARGTAVSTVQAAEVLSGPGDVRWELLTDAPEAGPPKAGSELLCVRVILPGTALLVAGARSNASLRRLLARGPEKLRAEALRLMPGSRGQWPADTALLLAACRPRIVIAGVGRNLPEEGSGMDLRAACQVHGARLLTPSREGSLRLEADATAQVWAYRGGRWQVQGD